MGFVHRSDVRRHAAVARSGPGRFRVANDLFFLLAIGDFINASPGFRQFAGYEGIFCGFSAIYAGLAQVLNEVYGKVVLPLGPIEK